jgi:ubiquinone/menaquinone biosynthesis C-methylase UbiE
MQILDAVWPLLRVALLLAACAYLLTQVRRPSKWAGRPFLWLMNNSHSKLTDWGLQHAQIDKNFVILDVGCGGGRTIEKLAAMAADGKVYGVDYAEGSVGASRSKNAAAIQAGRVKIKQASVSQLPFADNKFDLVTAIETQYYWPDLPKDMQELLRVLKPGGTLLIIAEVYRNGSGSQLLAPVMKLLGSSSLSVDDQKRLFSEAGYHDIQISEHHGKGWICARGKKPDAVSPEAEGALAGSLPSKS